MSPRAFVLMPFDKEFDEIYNLFITPTLSEAGYEVTRADDIVSQRNILKDILTSITENELIVADLTGANPNVYYELGLAHAFRRPAILLTQAIDELPFDLRAYRVIPYDTHFAAIDRARVQLRELARAAAAGQAIFSSPVSDFLAEFSAVPPVPIPEGPRPPNQEEGEPGFIDSLVSLEDGFARMTQIIEHVGETTRAISEEIKTTTIQMQEASASKRPNLAKLLQHLFQLLGEKQNAYADDLEESNDRFAESLAATGNSLELVITFKKPSTDEEGDNLRAFVASLAEVETSAAEGMTSFERLAEVMEGLPRIEITFSRATQKASIQIRRFANYAGQVVSMANRARVLAQRLLDADQGEEAAA